MYLLKNVYDLMQHKAYLILMRCNNVHPKNKVLYHHLLGVLHKVDLYDVCTYVLHPDDSMFFTTSAYG